VTLSHGEVKGADAMALFKKRTAGKPGEWFYCLEHKKVEEGPDCPAKDRFGPYASPEEARHAMDRARERDLEWETDPKWHDGGGAGGGPGEGSGVG
jgi:hypothetical protein